MYSKFPFNTIFFYITKSKLEKSRNLHFSLVNDRNGLPKNKTPGVTKQNKGFSRGNPAIDHFSNQLWLMDFRRFNLNCKIVKSENQLTSRRNRKQIDS